MRNAAVSFVPRNTREAAERGWNELDVIFVTGDAYIDHPAFGVPLLARWLESHGYRVGIIAQPDCRITEAFTVLGRPRLCFAVSAGAMDSMVAHYTPARKLRHDDAYTPGNRHGARPNRATIVYTGKLKQAYRDVPVLIGGIEASLRRFAHYDFWEDKVRRSILVDSKADLLIYGMAERPLLEIVKRLAAGENIRSVRNVRGTCWLAGKSEASDPALLAEFSTYVELPTFEQTVTSRESFAAAFRLASGEQHHRSGKPVVQVHGDRMLVCQPPAVPLSEKELDSVYALPFMKAPHPSYTEQIPAWEQIKTSITSHRGCFGGCAFCAIAMHQGRTIQSRSETSIVLEISKLTEKKWFRGSISDVGGPTANMYGLSCGAPDGGAACRRSSCLFPSICPRLACSDRRAVSLLRTIRSQRGVNHVTISSGVRYDLLEKQESYFQELVRHHVGGLLKVAPEHLSDRVTALMRKPGRLSFETFLRRFFSENQKVGKRQQIVPYLISGHPGCTLGDMLELALALKKLGFRVEQIQDFTPTPGSLSTCMFYTGIDPETGRKIHVPRSDREKGLQKALLLWHIPGEHAKILEALKELKREDLAEELLGCQVKHSESGPKKFGTERGRGKSGRNFRRT